MEGSSLFPLLSLFVCWFAIQTLPFDQHDISSLPHNSTPYMDCRRPHSINDYNDDSHIFDCSLHDDSVRPKPCSVVYRGNGTFSFPSPDGPDYKILLDLAHPLDVCRNVA